MAPKAYRYCINCGKHVIDDEDPESVERHEEPCGICNARTPVASHDIGHSRCQH